MVTPPPESANRSREPARHSPGFASNLRRFVEKDGLAIKQVAATEKWRCRKSGGRRKAPTIFCGRSRMPAERITVIRHKSQQQSRSLIDAAEFKKKQRSNRLKTCRTLKQSLQELPAATGMGWTFAVISVDGHL